MRLTRTTNTRSTRGGIAENAFTGQFGTPSAGGSGSGRIPCSAFVDLPRGLHAATHGRGSAPDALAAATTVSVLLFGAAGRDAVGKST
jgi:hypothetical protein